MKALLLIVHIFRFDKKQLTLENDISLHYLNPNLQVFLDTQRKYPMNLLESLNKQELDMVIYNLNFVVTNRVLKLWRAETIID
jgi:hypothetical protein